MSKVFMFMIAFIVSNIFMAWAMTEIGQEAAAIEMNMDLNATGVPTEAETSIGVLTMLWNAATFNIEGVPPWVQILIFGTMNTCMAIAIFFALRGVG